MSLHVSPRAAATELLRRRRARTNLSGFVNAVEIPGRPAAIDRTEWLFRPVESSVAAHHLLLCDRLERIAATPHGRLMVFMPPGSAKSTYGSVVFPAWFMGRHPGSKIILTSYGSALAKRHGRRARQLVRSPSYAAIFGTALSAHSSAADEWALTNGSEYIAGGILSGITGNRAHGLLIDDPVKGREEADSAVMRRKILDAYEDDLKTRLVPGGFIVIIQTRWHEDDLAGSILPKGWKGESGPIPCRDGHIWEVLCLPAQCDRPDDALGRRIGDYLWPEWFDEKHWAQFRHNTRTWSALYQQRPTPEEGAYFNRDWLRVVPRLPPPESLNVYGASDYAVTEQGGDYTVHMVAGIDPQGRMYVLDLWRQQAASDAWAAAWCDLVLKWKPLEWAEESGQINAGVGPFLLAMARSRKAYTFRRQFASRHNKAVRAQSIRGRMATDGLYIAADAPWRAELESELLRFPAGVHDDQVDALGLVGQLLDHIDAPMPGQKKEPSAEADWFDEPDDQDDLNWKVL